MKRFLAQLRYPVIPFDLFEELVARKDFPVEYLREKMQWLETVDRTRFLTLLAVLQFFDAEVVPRKESNLMTVQNVGICMAPCLMWARERSLKDIIYSTLAINVLNTLLQQLQPVFGDRKAQQKCFRSTYLHNKKKSIVENLSFLDLGNKSSEEPMEERMTPQFNEIVMNPTLSIMESLAEDSDDDIAEEAPTHELHSSTNPNRTVYRSHLVSYDKQEEPQQLNSEKFALEELCPSIDEVEKVELKQE